MTATDHPRHSSTRRMNTSPMYRAMFDTLDKIEPVFSQEHLRYILSGAVTPHRPRWKFW